MIGAIIVYLFATICEMMLGMVKLMWYLMTFPFQLFRKPKKKKKKSIDYWWF